MGNKPSSLLQDEEINIISEETGFSPLEIERLYSRFIALDRKGNGSLSRQDCLAIPELAINPLCDRIVQLFFSDCDEDHDRINFRQFMKVLATFRSQHRSLSRNSTRQDSFSGQQQLLQHHANKQQQQQHQLQQAPLLFDSIDPSPFSPGLSRHSRHSSYHDGFHHHHHHHHHHHDNHNHTTTNQHSFHYAASTNHLPAQANGAGHHHHLHHHLHQNGHHHHHQNGIAANGLATNPKAQPPIVDPDEPLNSKRSKLYFMFKIYDVNEDNLVCFDDLVAILKMMVGTYVDDARVQKIAQRSLREADKNNDGYIDFDEFCDAFAVREIDELLKVKFPHS